MHRRGRCASPSVEQTGTRRAKGATPSCIQSHRKVAMIVKSHPRKESWPSGPILRENQMPYRGHVIGDLAFLATLGFLAALIAGAL